MATQLNMAGETPTTVTLVGAGTIGISFAALYLQQAPHINVIICDTRPYLEIYVRSVLPSKPCSPQKQHIGSF